MFNQSTFHDRTVLRSVPRPLASPWHLGAVAAAVACLATTPAAHAQAVAGPPAAAASSADAGAPVQRIEIDAVRQKLDSARNLLSPDTGSTIYRFDQKDIANLPLGDATPLNQVLLRAPGVVQDSFAAGQIHIRGDHANVQYRLDGVEIPESVSGFAESLDTRFADRISLLTGALPAQYGYRTAGVVDIHTKGDSAGNGGNVEVTAGSLGHEELSGSVFGTSGKLSYFITGTGLKSDEGIENPTASRTPLHDDTKQERGLAYLSYLLTDTSRVSLMLGESNSRYQIPDVPGQTPAFMLANTPPLDSSAIDANQHEHNDFQILTFQSSIGDSIDYQASLFRRGSSVHYEPDPVGDLTYSGDAADILRTNTATGLQFDLSDRLNAQHTLRTGVFAQHESGRVNTSSSVFPADADGNQTSTTPETIVDNNTLGGNTYGIYLQDEWQPTKALTVNYGLRYDKVNTVVNESQWSPRLGVVYDLDADTRVHAGYARYFTPPPTEKIDLTSVAKFEGTTNALPSDANTAVKSERSNYYDAGVSHVVNKNLTIGLDGYYRQVRHLQDEGQFGSAFIFSSFNYDEGKIYGLELSSNYKDTHLTAYGNLALSAARGKGVETGQFNFAADELAYIASNWVHLDHEEKLSASAGATWRFGEGTTLGVDGLFGSGLRDGFANTDHLPSHTVFNATLTHGFDFGGGFGKLDARLALMNVGDRIYELRDGTGISVGAPQFGQRRTVFIALNKPFTF